MRTTNVAESPFAALRRRMDAGKRVNVVEQARDVDIVPTRFLTGTLRMDLRELLVRIQNSEATVEEALDYLAVWPYEELGFAKLDHHRVVRKGFPEVVFGPGKTPAQVAEIVGRLIPQADRILVTKTTAEAFQAVKAVVPDALFHEVARAIYVDRRPSPWLKPGVLVVAAGTADLPVAEEAALTAELMGSLPERLYDVGVAGIHRLMGSLDRLRSARVVVVVAGIEGALPSVIGGLVAAPVIAVPTSVGYGAHFGGLAPLLTMLNSCAPGVAVVNIDNGFGAGYLAGLINNLGAGDGSEA